MLPEIGEEGQRRLADAKVLVVGAGGLGSPITLYLAGAGVGTLALMDDDVVSLTNLHRQVLYGEDVLGMPKAVCATERLQRLNSDVHIITYPERLTPQNAAERIAAYDIVVDGTDNAAVRYLISDVCQALRKPYVYGAICGFEGQVAVLCAGHATDALSPGRCPSLCPARRQRGGRAHTGHRRQRGGRAGHPAPLRHGQPAHRQALDHRPPYHAEFRHRPVREGSGTFLCLSHHLGDNPFGQGGYHFPGLKGLSGIFHPYKKRCFQKN